MKLNGEQSNNIGLECLNLIVWLKLIPQGRFYERNWFIFVSTKWSKNAVSALISCII